jgi:hypothetical protein
MLFRKLQLDAGMRTPIYARHASANSDELHAARARAVPI